MFQFFSSPLPQVSPGGTLDIPRAIVQQRHLRHGVVGRALQARATEGPQWIPRAESCAKAVGQFRVQPWYNGF